MRRKRETCEAETAQNGRAGLERSPDRSEASRLASGEKPRNGARVKISAAAAFFDLDGTLMEEPSLERRFWKALHKSGEIPLGNYAAWIVEMVRQCRRGPRVAVQTNKRYLSGIASTCLAETRMLKRSAAFARTGGLRFLREGVERAAWHVRRGETIVLVTGTLEPLAVRAAAALRNELRTRDCETAVHICATRLEETRGRWTGRVLGEAMFGEAKARAVRALAGKFGLDLARCSAYGDSKQDRWMLGCVGHAFAVNASAGLRRVARAHGWPVLEWAGEKANHGRDKGMKAVRLCDGDAA